MTTIQNIQFSQITGTEPLTINLEYSNHLERYNILKKEYETFDKFHRNPILNEDLQMVNASMEILVLKDSGITEYEFEIVPTNKLSNMENYFSSILDNFNPTTIEKANLIQLRVEILESEGVKNTTSIIADETNLTNRAIQYYKNIAKIEPELQETLLSSTDDIGISDLVNTSKLTIPKQKKLNEEIKKRADKEKEKVSKKDYSELLNEPNKKAKISNNDFNNTTRLLADCITKLNKAKLTNNETVIFEVLEEINKYRIKLNKLKPKSSIMDNSENQKVLNEKSNNSTYTNNESEVA